MKPGDLLRDSNTGEVVRLTRPSKHGPRGAWLYRVLNPGKAPNSKMGYPGGGVLDPRVWKRVSVPSARRVPS